VYVLIFGVLVLIICGGCALKGQVLDGDDMVRSYNQITQDEAKKMMEKDDGHIIVDVRRQDEYDSGHIPGAVCIPNESITAGIKPEGLPDTDQIILIYCRTGRRSKEAAQKLFDTGYTNIYEFGGILDWTGEVVTESGK
jgi:rhodanese-related sulfurtransferase